MGIEAAFDILNTTSRLNTTTPDVDLWRYVSALLGEYGLSWSYSCTRERFFLIDIAMQWNTDIPDDYQVEPIGPVEQLPLAWDRYEVQHVHE